MILTIGNSIYGLDGIRGFLYFHVKIIWDGPRPWIDAYIFGKYVSVSWETYWEKRDNKNK